MSQEKEFFFYNKTSFHKLYFFLMFIGIYYVINFDFYTTLSKALLLFFYSFYYKNT